MKQIIFGLLLLLGTCASALSAQESDRHLQLMTFNIRYGNADDGANSWPNRRELVARTIDRFSADVLAIQEGLAFQLEELGPVLSAYRKLGQHRDGGLEGEFSGLYVDETRVRVLEWGEFWLSPTPDSVGSRGWDAALHRMAVWAELEHLVTGRRVRIYGTHFDHRGEVARLESARLILRHAGGGSPAVIMGDLNAGEESAPLRAFFGAGYRSAFLELHPDSPVGTFNGFTDPTGGRRIDHILLGDGLEPQSSVIADERYGGLWPSDHFAVTAVVAFPGGG